MSVRMSQMGVSPPRLELPEPIPAMLADTEGKILEVSLVGCSVHHPTSVKVGSNVNLQFTWKGRRAKLEAKVMRSTMQVVGGQPVYVSGLQLCESVEQSPAVIRDMVSTLVPPPPVEAVPAPAIETAPPPPPPPPAPAPRPAAAASAPVIYERVPFLRFQDDFDELDEAPAIGPAAAVAEPEPLFLKCTFLDGRWTRERVSAPEQPDEDGFTIVAPGDEGEVDALCRTYEVADEETRRMMRFSFELTIEQQRQA